MATTDTAKQLAAVQRKDARIADLSEKNDGLTRELTQFRASAKQLAVEKAETARLREAVAAEQKAAAAAESRARAAEGEVASLQARLVSAESKLERVARHEQDRRELEALLAGR